MLEYIKFPKIISNQNYELNNNNYLEYKIISKNNNSLVLMNTETIENERYWLINEIAQKIYSDKKKVIFIILDSKNNDNKIEIIIGSTYNSESLNVSFSKNILNIKEFSRRKNQILMKIKLIQDFYRNSDDIIVYSVQDENLEIVKQIFPKNNFIIKPLKNILAKTRYHQNLKNKITPFAIVFVVFLILNFVTSMFISSYTSTINQENINTKNKLNSELKQEKLKNIKLLNEEKSFNKIQKKALLLKNKIYQSSKKEF